MYFTKNIEDVDWAKCSSFLDRGIPEGNLVEYKSDLSTKGLSKDKWYEGADKLGKTARNKIVAEVVALANSQGGYLFLGVKETSDHPSRPCGLQPIPRCLLLKDKLLESISGSVDPTLPDIRGKAFVTEKDGAGIVVIEVPRSKIAPHRRVSDNNCFVRRQDRCESVDMRGIQDLAINSNRLRFEALWTAEFFAPGYSPKNGGVVILEAGRVFGGDANYYYHGYYHVIGNQLHAVIKSTYYSGPIGTAFGDKATEYTISAAGLLEGDQIKGKIHREGFGIDLDIVLKRQEPLP